ncbi:unnamed protein product [Blepharisma stoltei]|uniref:Tetratricopeptide repeat protein n=1 Tax=Blepharisma stoltei TaxID=1481888 RepID=A0AAU9JX73_9CILI|nr:unnamed protein product [Blepharisma stoltei]
MECYNEAIRIDPNYAHAYNSIGNIFYNKKKYEEAINVAMMQLESIQTVHCTIVIKELLLKSYAEEKKLWNAIKKLSELIQSCWCIRWHGTYLLQ